MEWVETTADSVEEAKRIVLDRLGVDESEAEFEVMEEPKQGLFGRTRGEARVRGRVRPQSPRSKNPRRERGSRDGDRRGKGNGSQNRSKGPRNKGENVDSNRTERAPRENREQVDPAAVAAEAEKFLLGLAEAFETPGSVSVNRTEEDMEVRLDGDNLGLMVGPKGATLLAIQDLTRVVSQRRLGDHESRLRIDIAGYREKRRDALSRFALKVAGEVKESGTARALEPMSSADRKIVHDALAGMEGIDTRSEGEDPNRRVVVAPA